MTEFPSEKYIKGLNKIGLITLIQREIERFVTVYTQTILAPMATTLMFYAVFALAFGGLAKEINGISYMVFITPGLIMMTMAQNAFANTSSSLVISKIQGNIVDVLMPPLSASELYCGYAAGAVCRGLIVGFFTVCLLALFVPIQIYSLSAVLVFAFLGSLMLGSLGIIGGIWSERFDHIAAVTNFIVTPLTFLSGTFYSIDMMPELWQKMTLFNPFFYMIDGFRYGFTGLGADHVLTGFVILSVINAILAFISYKMIKTGYKIKS
ncbi:MAG: ABC transporter permease [Alphaproteobacteria bacterium]|nr:ABC transporter permease [Alphaproteobacteria bacterium]